MNESFNSVESSLDFSKYDWFHSADVANSIVYVNYMNEDVWNIIPYKNKDSVVKIHFAASLLASKSDFIENLSEVDENIDFEKLESECNELRKDLNYWILESLFYEVHDGDDSITNYRSRFPGYFGKLKTLYDSYGYDLLFEELKLK